MKSDLISVNIAACTDVGLVRKNNEDSFLVADINSGQMLGEVYRVDQPADNLCLLLAVSDGMGGQLAGEVASRFTVEVMRERLMKLSRKIAPYDRLVQAVEEANYQVYHESERHAEYKGMGATLTAALVEGDKVYIAEVGDSRAYLIRNGRIKQVTTDQSLMEVLVSRGLISQTDAERSSNRGVLLQAIGTKEEIQVAITSMSLQSQDCLLLCSDGLSNKVKPSELLQFVNKLDPQAACHEMIVMARQRGGEDNITALIANFNGEILAAKESGAKITTTLQALSTFDPDRPKTKKRTQRLSSIPASKNLVYPSTVGIGAPSRDLKSYPQREELSAEFERLSYHLEKSAESLRTELEGLRRAADWLQQGGALDARLPEIFAKLKSAQTALEQTRKSVGEAKVQFKGK